MNFADNLKKIRKENNLSQEQIAEKLGVSRQSVSKWESGQAYPEMDKMIQICQIFNLNIDDLLNQDIKEVNNNKKAKSNINRFIDDFLGYITKTVDMFSSMSFKEKIKCVFEQLVNIFFISFILFLIGIVGGIACSYLFSFLLNNIYIYRRVTHFIGAIYILFALTLEIILLLHIFKVRYLDYYVIAKKIVQNDDYKEEIDDLKETRKVVLEKKIEKIIIRDPNHSEHKFISWLVRLFLIFIKIITCFIGLLGCITLVFLIGGFILSLSFIKTGILFLGILLSLVALIIINIVALIIIYNFIISKENKKNVLALSFLIALILGGIGIGLFFTGISKFKVVQNMNDETIFNFEMSDVIFFFADTKIKYVESDNKDIKVVIKHNKLNNISYSIDSDGSVYFYNYSDDSFELLRDQVKNINEYKIVDYNTVEIYIYTNSKNIETIQAHQEQYYNSIKEREDLVNELNTCTLSKQELEDNYQLLQEELDSCKMKVKGYQEESN